MEAVALLNAITGGLFAMAGMLMVWAARTLYALVRRSCGGSIGAPPVSASSAYPLRGSPP